MQGEMERETQPRRILERERAESGDTSQLQRQQDGHEVLRKHNATWQRENKEYGLI